MAGQYEIEVYRSAGVSLWPWTGVVVTPDDHYSHTYLTIGWRRGDVERRCRKFVKRHKAGISARPTRANPDRIVL